MNELSVIIEQDVLGKSFKVYGTTDNPVFLAKDVASWIEHSNPTEMAKVVDDNEKLNSTILSAGQTRECTFLTEDGLYEVLMQSRKPIAKAFKREVKGILKSIRKHGAYMTPETLEAAILNPDTMIRVLTALKDEQSKNIALNGEVAKRDQIIAELNPKATYYDLILQCTGSMSPSKIAKDYGKSARWLNEKLHELGIQFKQGKVWLLYQKHASCGYTQSRTFPIVHADGTPDTQMSTYWTQKGRLFIYDLLKNNGVVPIIEREAA